MLIRRIGITLCVVISAVLYGVSGTSSDMLLYAGERQYTEEELGIRKETLYDERSTVPSRGEPGTKEPGESILLERSFENSPPLISHDVTGMLPLSRTENICLDCHMPEEAVSMGATPIPRSHLFDLKAGKDLKGMLSGERYNCMQCHVIQNVITAPVVNVFEGEFREDAGRYRSNLIDILNEGVNTE